MRISVVTLLVYSITLSTSAFGNVKNESQLQITGESQKDRWFQHKGGQEINLIKSCKGAVPKDVNLKAAGLSADDLKKGVSCVAEDFDGNGYLDFVLYGSKDTKLLGDQEVTVGIKLLVLFYKGKELLKTQLIRNGAKVFVFDPKDPDRINYPEYDSKHPALIRPGEGDRGYVYFFNPKTASFEEGHWVAPPGYEMGD
jgi:hypothetical protein